jgi:hypothetical protein
MRFVNFYIFFSIELSKFHNMSSGFSGITWVGLALITKVPVTLTWVNFFRFFFSPNFTILYLIRWELNYIIIPF